MTDPTPSRKPRWAIPSTALTLGVVAYLVVFGNLSFWRSVTAVVEFDSFSSFALGGALGLVVFIVLSLLLLPVSMLTPGRWVKPLLIVFLLLSAVTGYFMDSYGIVIDDSMLQNVVLTDRGEALELMTWQLLLYLCLHTLIPGVAVYLIAIRPQPRFRELLTKIAGFCAVLLLLVAVGLIWYKELVLLGRQHREIRLYMNPSYPIYSGYLLVKEFYSEDKDAPLRTIAADARRTAFPEKTVAVLVIGETARASQFGLNGYARDTTPLLGELDLLSFTQVRACATSTAEALPCIFSSDARKNYSRREAVASENLLDVLTRSGVSVLWRDNNSGSQGLADRVVFEDLAEAEHPRLCSAQGCFDEILLEDLDEKMAAMPGDGLVVLHQNGSHGPAYYKRTPPEFKKFMPECDLDSLQNCERQEIVNAYDNTILYTDFVLAKLIAMLERQPFPTVMIFVSDHGESLGENNIFLHGLPMFLAPEDQTHVPMLLWASQQYKSHGNIDFDRLTAARDSELTHDYIFHSTLGFFGVESLVYDPALDIFATARRRKSAN